MQLNVCIAIKYLYLSATSIMFKVLHHSKSCIEKWLSNLLLMEIVNLCPIKYCLMQASRFANFSSHRIKTLSRILCF